MTEPTPSAGATPVAGGATPPQTPPAAAGSPTPPVPPPASGSPSDDDDLGPRGLSALEKERAARRDAEAQARTAKEELTKLQNAQLSEAEKQTKRLTDLERAQTDWTRERSELLLSTAVERQATKLGFADPADAMNLLRRTDIEFETDGTPKNVEKLLKDLIKAKPYLAGAGTPGADLGSSGDGGSVLTREQISKMSAEEINRRWPEVQAAMGRI